MVLHPLDPFPFGWFHAAFEEDLAPGDVRPLHLLNRHFVLWRDELGEAHVLDAFCAHLGAHLGYGGRVEECSIRCPFHAWRYDAEGECVEIPYSDKRHKLAGLRSYPVVERNGMTMFWWHPDGLEPLWELPQLREWTDPGWTDDYVRQHWRVRTKWREIAENGIDLTHFHYLHGVATVPELDYFHADEHVWHSNAVHQVHTPLGPTPGNFELELHGPGFAWMRFGIEGLAEILFVITITQVDDEWVDNRFSFLAKRPARSDVPDRSEALIQEVIDQVTDDVPIWENKIVKDPPRLARGDGPIMAFRKWATQFSAAAESAEADPRHAVAAR